MEKECRNRVYEVDGLDERFFASLRLCGGHGSGVVWVLATASKTKRESCVNKLENLEDVHVLKASWRARGEIIYRAHFLEIVYHLQT